MREYKFPHESTVTSASAASSTATPIYMPSLPTSTFTSTAIGSQYRYSNAAFLSLLAPSPSIKISQHYATTAITPFKHTTSTSSISTISSSSNTSSMAIPHSTPYSASSCMSPLVPTNYSLPPVTVASSHQQRTYIHSSAHHRLSSLSTLSASVSATASASAPSHAPASAPPSPSRQSYLTTRKTVTFQRFPKYHYAQEFVLSQLSSHHLTSLSFQHHGRFLLILSTSLLYTRTHNVDTHY
jgi:hypothetical protein